MKNKEDNKLLTVERFEILRSLYEQRNECVGSWNPDYTNFVKYKWCIVWHVNLIKVSSTFSVGRMLTFPTREMATEFAEKHLNELELVWNLI